MRRTIALTITLPDREEEKCPKCGSGEMYDDLDPDDPPPCSDEWHLYEKTVELPAKFVICNRCKGEGTHVNPNIDGHGISMEEWYGPDWDDESREMYMNGGYDVRCEAGCDGGKVLVPDEEACTNEPLKSQLAEYEKQQAERARSDAEDRRTRYMESGGSEGSWW